MNLLRSRQLFVATVTSAAFLTGCATTQAKPEVSQPQTVQGMNNPEDWPFDQARNVTAVSDASVVARTAPILLVIHYSEDHSWAFLSGAPFKVEQGKLIGMGTAFGLDPTLRSIADLPPGWTATRRRVGDEWVRQPDPDI